MHLILTPPPPPPPNTQAHTQPFAQSIETGRKNRKEAKKDYIGKLISTVYNVNTAFKWSLQARGFNE